MRGGLDDALDKLARRDELRRRTAGEATGTPPAVQELAEAIATVVGRNPKLGVTVGVEGAGDPVLLHFAVENGVVQVSLDNSVASRVAEAAPTSPRHADFDIDLEEADPVRPATTDHPPEPGMETRRISYDDRDRYDPGTGYAAAAYGDSEPTTATPAYPQDVLYADPVASDRRYEGHRRYDDDFTDFLPPRNGGGSVPPEPTVPIADSSRHPFAATPPPPVPPQTSRRMHAEQHRAPEPSSAQRGMPTPLPRPIPLKVDSEETELAARRLAALLRDNPSLLRQSPPD